MRKQFTNMGYGERIQNNIIGAEVANINKSEVDLLWHHPNGENETIRMVCSFADELKLGEYVDLQPYLTGSCTGYKLLGMTPPEYTPIHTEK